MTSSTAMVREIKSYILKFFFFALSKGLTAFLQISVPIWRRQKKIKIKSFFLLLITVLSSVLIREINKWKCRLGGGGIKKLLFYTLMHFIFKICDMHQHGKREAINPGDKITHSIVGDTEDLRK